MVSKTKAKKETQEQYEVPTTENIPIGQPVWVEVVRPDGSTSGHLGRFQGCSINEICLSHHSWVAETGRRHLFLMGKPDSTYEVEVSPPETIKRLPRWLAEIQDWPHELPEQSQ